jgi:hypothetical protein
MEAAMATIRATIIVGTLSLAAGSALAWAQTEKPQPPKAGKERPPAAAVTADKTEVEGVSKQKKLTMCLETWDANTHMTKREWRVACARSVRDYPDAFDR